MKQQSLNEIMNEMAQGLKPLDVGRNLDFSQTASMEELSELDAFASMDDLLDGLQKEYLDAKAQRKELCNLMGADDAMSMIVLDMEDSAWCAMQTRYLELREERHLMEEAQVMMRQRKKLITEKKAMTLKACKEKEARDFSNYLHIIDKIKEQNKTPKIFEWLVLFMIFRIDILGRPMDKSSYQNMSMA